MSRSEIFYQKIREGEFANTEFPLQGVNVLYPHGKALLNNLEIFATNTLSGMSYEEVGLPELVPKDFISHLDQESLFKAENKYRSFFLAGSAELQSVFLAQKIVHSHRDLPLRLYSLSGVRRESNTTALIKDIEFRLLELNAFFSSKEDATSELIEINNAFAKLFTQLEIPYIVVNQDKIFESPTIFFTRFPFSNTFGSLFWSNIVGTRYSQALEFTFHGKDNKRHAPVQLNGGLTSRIFAAYLAHHQDDFGFILDPLHSPYQILTSKLSNKTEDTELLKIIHELGIRSKSIHGDKSTKSAKFKAMGTPLLVEQGRREYVVTRRNDHLSLQATVDTLKSMLIQQLHNQISKSNRISKIQIERLNTPLPDTQKYLAEKVYVIDKQYDTIMQTAGLKRIGYFDNQQACFVCKKY